MKNIYYIIHEILTSFFYYQNQNRKSSDNVSPSSSNKIITDSDNSPSGNAVVQTILYLRFINIINPQIMSFFLSYINFNMYRSNTGESGKLIIMEKF